MSDYWQAIKRARARDKMRRACGEKKAYFRADYAEDAIAKLLRSGRSDGRPLRVYACEFCGFFHFGHTGASAPQPFAKAPRHD